MRRRKLPAGVQTLRKIREDDCYYVDKTAYIHQLVTGCSHCFLSRPRRFGKSLLVDTIKELFEGNEPLFRGLAIHDRWDWTVRHPVLRFSFAGGSFKGLDDAQEDFLDQLTGLEHKAGVKTRFSSPARRLAGLIGALHEQTGQRGMLLFLQNREFRPYWFETGTPAFLPDTLLERRVDPASLNDLTVGDADLAAFDIRHAKTEALLFQTGYLTILGEERSAAGYLYRLGYPNREVRSALNLALLTAMVPDVSATVGV